MIFKHEECSKATLGFVLVALGAVSQMGCTRAASAPKPLTPVRTAEVQTISTGSETRYSANIVPNAQVDLAFKSGGYVASIRQVRGADGHMRNIDTGDWVVRGTVLAVVRQQDYTDHREQAQAQLARAQSDYEHGKLTFDRTSNLYAVESATKPEFDQAKAQYDSSVAALNNAKAGLAEAQTALEDSSLRAPFDGWVIRRNIDIGALVNATTPAFTIADTRSVRAVFGVPDNAIGRIKLGQHQAITTDALTGEFPGRVSAISPAADPKSRVYSVEVTIPNLRNQLKSGMIASLAVGGEMLPATILAIPLSAVIRDPQNPKNFAALTADGSGSSVRVQSHTIELGDAHGNMIQVLSGLNPGDRVVTAGATLIRSGDTVRLMQ